MTAADDVGDEPVQPVWCAAPIPAALSPWKYSENTRLSRQRGSCLHALHAAEAGPAPVGSAEEDRDHPLPQVVGDRVQRQPLPGPGGVLEGVVVAEEAVVALQRRGDEVVQREPDRARASWSCRRTWPWWTPRARSRWWRGCRRRRAGRGARGGRPTARAARTGTGTRRGRTACRTAARAGRGRRRSATSVGRPVRRAAVRACSCPRGRACPRGRGTRANCLPMARRLSRPASSATPAASIGMIADHRPHPHRHRAAVGQREPVVEQPVDRVPEVLVLDRGADGGEVFEELQDQVVGRPVRGPVEDHRDDPHGQRVGGHPAGGVGLFEHRSGRQVGAVERADVVQAEEPALEQVGSRRRPGG